MPLTGTRVIDLTGPEGQLCGKILADLGADVIQVEPPEGDEGRRWGPFQGDTPDPEKSLFFLAYNSNKKSVVLNSTSPTGRERLVGLIATSDVVLESGDRPTLKAAGLTYERLAKDNPGLVAASITGLGSWGPHSHFKAPNIVVSAMGGLMHLAGTKEREPLCEPFQQPYQAVSILAAYGVLLALYDRRKTGRGQRVEVSAQELLASQQHLEVNYSVNGTIFQRQGPRGPLGGGAPFGLYPTKDGYCSMLIVGPRHWKGLVRFMGNPEALADPLWENRHVRNASIDFIDTFVSDFSANFTKQGIFHEGQKQHLTFAPLNTPAEFIADHHNQERGFFINMDHPRVGRYLAPGPVARFNGIPARKHRAAPLLGEHTDEVLNASQDRHISARRGAVRKKQGAPPLSGIRIVDFTQAVAGPHMTRLLAEMGAEVIKVESTLHQQRGRLSPDGDPRIVRQQWVTFSDLNRNKKCITLNMAEPRGRFLVKQLISKSDAVVENFSPGVMEKWGLGYEQLKALKSDIIMMRLPGFGLTGPYRDYLCMAPLAQAITGIFDVWRYHDDPNPVGPPVWTPDHLNSFYSAGALVAALLHRDSTGEGQMVEVAQVEANASLLAVAYIDASVNGAARPPAGNRSPRAAPHGCYPSKGADRWCVIAAETEEEWQAFRTVMGNPTWAKDEKFGTLSGRLQHQDELDSHIAEWTRDHTPHQVMYMLQRAGVPAGAVQNAEDVFHDPQLRQRGFFVRMDDPDVGPVDYPGLVVHLSETPGRVQRCAQLGEQNLEVFGSLLGLSFEEIRRLEADQVLF